MNYSSVEINLFLDARYPETTKIVWGWIYNNSHKKTYNKVIKLDPLNSIAYYYKGLTYYTMENISKAIVAFEKCVELDPNDHLSKMLIEILLLLQQIYS